MGLKRDEKRPVRGSSGQRNTVIKKKKKDEHRFKRDPR